MKTYLILAVLAAVLAFGLSYALVDIVGWGTAQATALLRGEIANGKVAAPR